MKIFSELMWFFKQEKKAYLRGVFVLLIVAVLQVIPPRIVGIVIDEIDKNTLTGRQLLGWIAVLVLAALSMYVLRFVWRVSIFGSSNKLARLTRSRLFEHFTNLPMSFYQRKRTGDLMAHATNDIQAIQQTAGFGVLSLFDSLSQGTIVIIAMLLINWKLAIIVLLPLPIMAILANFYGGMLFKSFHLAQEAFSNMNDRTHESINGVKVIKSFGQEKEEIAAFIKQAEDVTAKNYTVARIDGLFDPTISMISGICFLLSFGFGGYYVTQNVITIGALISFTTYLGLLIWPMLAFGFLFNVVERGSASYSRIKTLLAEEVEIADEMDVINATPSGDLHFMIDSFTYPNETIPVLKNVHFHINKGETLGVVGKTGAGKSTLLKLLVRAFDLTDGNIIFGDHRITRFKLSNLRKSVGYVPQDNFLFSTTIRENIAFAKTDLALEAVMEAATLANIHRDIEEFSDGYETIVGERGVALSGGQKQRIAIARALLLNTEVLILDDSLSAVDAKTEEIIISNLRQNRLDKTTIITSHRLSAVKHSQQIIVFDEGEIAQIGTHEELMRQQGWYKEMYLKQQLEESIDQDVLTQDMNIDYTK